MKLFSCQDSTNEKVLERMQTKIDELEDEMKNKQREIDYVYKALADIRQNYAKEVASYLVNETFITRMSEDMFMTRMKEDFRKRWSK